MRTLTAGQQTAAAASARSVVTIVRIDWASPVGTRYYTDRDVSIDPAITAEPILLGVPELRRELTTGIEGTVWSGEYTFTMENHPHNPDRIGLRLASLVTANGTPVRIYKVLETGSALSSSDWMDFGLYRIIDYTERTADLTLIVEDWFRQLGRAYAGKRLELDDFSTLPARSSGLIVPIIFGTVEDCPAILVESGQRTNLQGAIDAVVTAIPVDSVSGFPASGTIVIDNEEITYTAVDSVSTPNTFGTAGTPATRGVRGAAAAHNDNTAVREKLSRYRFALCWHWNISNGNVRFRYAGEDYGVGAGVSITETTLDGHNITYVDFTELPQLSGGYLMTERDMHVLVDVEGFDDPYTAGSQGLSDPANVIRHLIAGSDFYGLSLDYLDTTSLDAAVAAVGGNIVFGRRLYLRQRLRDLLSSAIADAGILGYWEGGQLRFVPGYAVGGLSAVRSIDRDDIFPVNREALDIEYFLGPVERRVYRMDSDVVNRITLRYRQDFLDRQTTGEGSFSRMYTYDEAISQAQTWGIREQEILSLWIRDATSAAELATHLGQQKAWRRTGVVFQARLEHMDLEIGDVVEITHADTRLNGNRGRVTSMHFPQRDRLQITLSSTDTRTRIWEHDANNYIDLYQGVGWLIFVVGGAAAMFVDNTGLVHVGSIREERYASDTVQVDEIDYNGGDGTISLAVPRVSDGSWIRVAELDTNGRLRCARFRERSDLPLTEAASPSFSTGYVWSAADGALDFSLDLFRTFVRFNRIEIGGQTNARFDYNTLRTDL